MAFTYEFNQQSAVEAKSGGDYIKDSGVYDLRVVEAIPGNGNGSSEYVEFSFEDKDKKKANFVKLYTKKNDGNQHWQSSILDAMMGILNLRTLSEQQRSQGPVIPEFYDKFLMVKLQREEYIKNDGSEGYAMKIINVYDRNSRKSYSETAANLPAVDIDLPVEDKKAKPRQAVPHVMPQGYTQPAQQGVNPNQGAFSPAIDQDLPF